MMKNGMTTQIWMLKEKIARFMKKSVGVKMDLPYTSELVKSSITLKTIAVVVGDMDEVYTIKNNKVFKIVKSQLPKNSCIKLIIAVIL